MKTFVLVVLAIAFTVGCAEETVPTGVTEANAPRTASEGVAEPSAAATRADIVLELRQQDEFVVVMIERDALGTMAEDETWERVEKVLATFVNEHPEHAKPKVQIKSAHVVNTAEIVRAANRLFQIGVEDVSYSGAPPRVADANKDR